MCRNCSPVPEGVHTTASQYSVHTNQSKRNSESGRFDVFVIIFSENPFPSAILTPEFGILVPIYFPKGLAIQPCPSWDFTTHGTGNNENTCFGRLEDWYFDVSRANQHQLQLETTQLTPANANITFATINPDIMSNSQESNVLPNPSRRCTPLGQARK